MRNNRLIPNHETSDHNGIGREIVEFFKPIVVISPCDYGN